MRVTELDRDMSDVFPTGMSPDSTFLYARMQQVTFDALRIRPGARVLDVASGVGQDDRALARRGVRAVAAEPSARMHALAQLTDAEDPVPVAVWRVRAWSESLPFARSSFDASFCKGSLDHFDDPAGSVREMARVTRANGRVVVAVANFESLGCRASRLLDRLRRRGARPRGRRYHDVPSDHFTRYDPGLVRSQLGELLHIEEWLGLSLLWGVGPWARFLARLGPRTARALLRAADWAARRFPRLADVIVVSGRPRLPFES